MSMSGEVEVSGVTERRRAAVPALRTAAANGDMAMAAPRRPRCESTEEPS